jgi:hypothetical protein
MAERFIELTRVGGGGPVLVNTDNIAWVMPGADGTSHIVFAVALTHESKNGSPLALDVQEPIGVVQKLLGSTVKQATDALKQAFDKMGR